MIKYRAEVAFALNLQYMSPRQVKIPKIGNQGQNGTLNGLGLSGSVFLKIRTAIQIIINEVNVPKLQSSADRFKSINSAQIITINPDSHVITCGVLNLGCTAFKDFGKNLSRLIAHKILVVPN